MVDFANANLCGASIALNDVLSKLEDTKAEIKSKLDFPDSTAAAAFLAKANELSGLKNKLQTIEIPTIPKLNLQSEISSLLSQTPGSIGYISSLAKITLEFKDDIEAKGLNLETLVNAAAISSDLICSIVPNLEKESGSVIPAIENPVAVKQADAKAVTEIRSVIWQNPDITSKVKSLEEKTTAYSVTNEIPTKNVGAFRVATKDFINTISVMPTVLKNTTTDVRPVVVPSLLKLSEKTSEELKSFAQEMQKVVKQGSGNNIAPSGIGFTDKKNTISKIFSTKKLAALQNQNLISNDDETVTLDILALKEITDTLPKNATNIIPAFNKAADKLIVKYSVLENYDADIKTT